jgi:hypothetical protein
VTQTLSVHFFAPIPVGHRVNVIWLDVYVSALFSAAAAWMPVHLPLVIDLDTGILYGAAGSSRIVAATSPPGLKPDCGHRVRATHEYRVSACVVESSGGDAASLSTELVLMELPQGYR